MKKFTFVLLPLFAVALQAQTPAPEPKPATTDLETIQIKDDAAAIKEDMKSDLGTDNSVPNVSGALENSVRPDPAAQPEIDKSALPEALKALSDDKLREFATLKDEAISNMRTVKLQEALDCLFKADSIVGQPLAELENLRGAIFTKMRDFATAKIHFEKALSLEGDSFHPKFNLAELEFVQKNWATAHTAFSALIIQNEQLRSESIQKAKKQDATEEQIEMLAREFGKTQKLMQFKILICELQQNREAEAKKILSEFNRFDDDSPAYYFGQAAICFHQSDKDTAEEWITSAKRIYQPAANDIFIDSFVEMGWLQTLN